MIVNMIVSDGAHNDVYQICNLYHFCIVSKDQRKPSLFFLFGLISLNILVFCVLMDMVWKFPFSFFDQSEGGISLVYLQRYVVNQWEELDTSARDCDVKLERDLGSKQGVKK